MLESIGKDCATLRAPVGFGGGNVVTHVAGVVDLEARKLATLSHPQTPPSSQATTQRDDQRQAQRCGTSQKQTCSQPNRRRHSQHTLSKPVSSCLIRS